MKSDNDRCVGSARRPTAVLRGTFRLSPWLRSNDPPVESVWSGKYQMPTIPPEVIASRPFG